MASLFSIPTFPGATSYTLQYSDPGSDANAPNPFGPWSNLQTVTTTSNIVDSAGTQNLRMYRVAPTVTINGSPFTYPYFNPFSVAMSDPGVYTNKLFDPQITVMIPSFRSFVGDNGTPQTSSTQINLDSGAGSGLLQPDGTTTAFYLADVPDAVPATILEYSVQVIKNGHTLVLNTDYIVNYEAGQVIFATAPAKTDQITINFTEVRYTNRILANALANAMDRLAGLGISGYGLSFDNNVCLAIAPIGNDGLRFIVFLAAQKILNQAVIWAKAQAARSYKTGDFSMDTAPQRILDGMSAQTQVDFSEMKDATDKYIRSATRSVSYGDFDSFLDVQGLLPAWSALWLGGRYGGFYM